MQEASRARIKKEVSEFLPSTLHIESLSRANVIARDVCVCVQVNEKRRRVNAHGVHGIIGNKNKNKFVMQLNRLMELLNLGDVCVCVFVSV